MAKKWTLERRERFRATLAAKRARTAIATDVAERLNNTVRSIPEDSVFLALQAARRSITYALKMLGANVND